MAHFLFPKPRDWEVFEDIVCDVYSRKYQSDNFQRYARRGQRQHGVDVVGKTHDGLIGIQCKHRTTNNAVSEKDIDDEITKAETFTPTLSKLLIVTSADPDGEIQSHVLGVSEKRIARNHFPVEIVFWQELVDKLIEYPDLLYKHLTKHFPPDDFGVLVFPGIENVTKETIEWPVSGDNLKAHIDRGLAGMARVEPYSLSIGVSSFPDVGFWGRADVQISLQQFMTSEGESPEGFLKAHQVLTAFRSTVQSPYFSRELTVHLQTRLSLAVLVGWVFREVTGSRLRIIGRNGVWTTWGLPARVTGVFDDLPEFLNRDSKEVAIVLNLSQRNIVSSVREYVSGWSSPPQVVLSLSLSEGRIVNAGHALSIAREIALKLKNLTDRWETTHIHVFGVMPSALACLIGYHLNAICPISLYFRDESRTKYQLAGTLKNTM